MSNIHFTTFGAGDIDILLVHGWASSGQIWGNVTRQLRNARFWAFDFPGFGETPMPEEVPTIEDHAHTLIRFCDEHDLRPQMMVAHSMGGLITLKAVSIRPDLAQQLVLISPVVTGKFGIGGILSGLLRTELASSVFRDSEQFWPLIQQEHLVKLALSSNPRIKPDLVQQITDDFLATDPRAGIEAVISMTQVNMQPYLTEITQPALVCVGKWDLTVPPYEGRTAATYMPNAKLVTFKRSRHRPMDEEIEKFGRVFKKFAARFGIK